MKTFEVVLYAGYYTEKYLKLVLVSTYAKAMIFFQNEQWKSFSIF